MICFMILVIHWILRIHWIPRQVGSIPRAPCRAEVDSREFQFKLDRPPCRPPSSIRRVVLCTLRYPVSRSANQV
eukprot:1185438-Prorocentrum_minimum.AAC.6